jgi:quercetin dioxygenase-like cupin family protein
MQRPKTSMVVGMRITMHRFLLASALLLGLAAPVAAQEPAKVTTLFSRDLSDIPGKEGTMLIVEYPPGGADPVHRHNANAFVYVLEGSVIMQVRGSEPVTLHAGETFYEGPNDIHVVGRNASKTEPAKFLVVLVKNKGAPALIPVE